MLPWFGVIVDKNVDPEKILSVRQGGCGLTSLPSGVGVPRLPFPIPSRKSGK